MSDKPDCEVAYYNEDDVKLEHFLHGQDCGVPCSGWYYYDKVNGDTFGPFKTQQDAGEAAYQHMKRRYFIP